MLVITRLWKITSADERRGKTGKQIKPGEAGSSREGIHLALPGGFGCCGPLGHTRTASPQRHPSAPPALAQAPNYLQPASEQPQPFSFRKKKHVSRAVSLYPICIFLDI